MTTAEGLNLAVECYRIPSRFRSAMGRRPPEGMLSVIKGAAGDEDTIRPIAEAYKMDQADVQEACKHFLLRILLDPKTKGPGLLGLSENATEEDVKLHKRWLLKWLHPDRNPNTWERALFLKVNAFQLSSPEIERRASRGRMNRSEVRHFRKQMEGPAPTQRRSLVAWRALRPVAAVLVVSGLLVWMLMASRNSPNSITAWLGKFLSG
jgi:hypothetical protein